VRQCLPSFKARVAQVTSPNFLFWKLKKKMNEWLKNIIEKSFTRTQLIVSDWNRTICAVFADFRDWSNLLLWSTCADIRWQDNWILLRNPRFFYNKIISVPGSSVVQEILNVQHNYIPCKTFEELLLRHGGYLVWHDKNWMICEWLAKCNILSLI